MDVEQRQEILAMRGEIEALEKRLKLLYHQRAMMILAQAETMTRREIGALWNVSNVRVTGIVNRPNPA